MDAGHGEEHGVEDIGDVQKIHPLDTRSELGVESQVERNLADECEQPQPQQVLFSAPGVAATLRDEECVNGESDASNTPEKGTDGQREYIQRCGRMVDNHSGHGDTFQVE